MRVQIGKTPDIALPLWWAGTALAFGFSFLILLKQFLGDKLNITGSALTPREIEQQLSVLAIPREKIRELLEVLHTLESGQFAMRQLGAVEKEKLLRGTIQIVRWLDKRMRQVS